MMHMVSLILPKAHRDTLEVLFVFLKWVASFAHLDEETGSKMDLQNLATVICPSILYSRGQNAVRDESFGSTVLLVCAIGSRYSSDERVLLNGLSNTGLWYSAGWPWFRRVQQGRKILELRNATLYDLQVPIVSNIWERSITYALTLLQLASIYFYGSPTIYAACKGARPKACPM